ncbi:HAMP domain-containing sensor histidine kinase [Pedococcus bigeumensis]|uniref:histidine kinase n=1 Tax=Pedococcus bigeumensis TaxID=433644 RepID=A0A502D2B3_9MICO|nr:HAMP domain-containing sensor histidine kinase [Pedococcus bigeumensis]TPG19054.1 sensor histidine kinase [Pedococcus bigeumensis]
MSVGGPVGRGSLERRTAALMAAVVTIAVVVAGLVSVGLVRGAAQDEARKALRSKADLVSAVLEASRPVDITPALRVVRQQDTPVAWEGPGGRLAGDALARTAYTQLPQVQRTVSGSHTLRIDGRSVLVEVRPLSNGATVVFAERTSLAAGQSLRFLNRVLLALVIGLVLAVLASVLFARRLAAPLRSTAAAAHRMASGERSVRVVPAGPAEVAETGESLNALAEALEHSERRQREFLLSVSHELRTPLGAVKGFAEGLQDGVITGDAVPGAGRTIVAESARLERLVADLLDLARLGADDFRFDTVALDLRDVVDQAAEVWGERCRREGVRFAVERPPAAVLVRTDPVRVRQVIDGLAENALRVTEAGAPLVLALRADSSHAVLEVRDGGPGLTTDDMAVAFERSELYQRYRGIRRVGTGLGLALVKALVDGLGGSVSVQPAPAEGGTCFRVELPLT